MKNLKRALSFALATVMLVGMMVVGVSAASFGDADEIVNTEAVNTMVALGIIKGKDNGNFDPEGIVTRAEMAKMICVALNGGKDPNLSGGGMYADTKGHWASGYIDYCTNLGIVSGDTAGNFNPDKTVTGTEAAKMILIALGFNAENEKYVNDANWALNINVDANTKGLYEDVNVLPAEGLSRDNAAQMIWNGLQADMIKYDYQLNTIDGNLVSVAIAQDILGKTILGDKFSMLTYEGYMQDATYSSTDKTYTYAIGKTMSTTPDNTAANGYTLTKVAEDYSDLFGQKVKVLYKATDKVYGIYSKTDVILSTEAGELPTLANTDTSFKLDNVTYKFDTKAEDVVVYDHLNKASNAKLDTIDGVAAKATYALNLFDTNADGKIDSGAILPFTVEKVTYVGSKGITAGTGYTFENDNIADGIAKNDFVKIVSSTNTVDATTVITKLDTISGDVAGLNGDKVLIDGVWYTKVANTGDAFALGETYTVSVVGKYYYNAKKTSGGATADDLIYVSGAEDATNLKAAQAKVYLTDGTNTIVTVDKVGSTSTKAGTGYGEGEITAGLYTFEINDDGNYELTAVSATNKAGFGKYVTPNTYTAATKTADAKLGTYTISNDATLFVVYNTGVTVLTGETVNNWAAATLTSTNLLTSAVNGLDVVKAGLITVNGGKPSAAGETGNYGYVVSDPYQVKDGSSTYMTYKLWNGTEVAEVIEKSSTTEAAKGLVVSYTDLGSGYIKDVDKDAVKTGAITGFSAKSMAVAAQSGELTTYAITDDTVFLYVDSEKVEGVAGGEIALAATDATGGRVQNVYIIPNANTSTNLDLVVYEIGNQIDGAAVAGYTISAATNSGTGVTGTVKTTKVCEGDSITVALETSAVADGDDDVTVTLGGTQVKANSKTVTVKDGTASGAKYTVEIVLERTSTTAITGPVSVTVSGTVG